MEIIKESKDNKVKISELEEGDVIIYCGHICMIIDDACSHEGKYDNDEYWIVDLSCGETDSLMDWELVEKVENARLIY